MTRTSRGHGTLPQASSLGGVTKTWPGHSRDRGDITSQDRIRLRHDQTWPNDMEDSWPGSYLQKSRRADWHMTGTWPEKLTCITCDIHWLYISGLVKSAGNSFHRCPDVCQRRAIRAVPLVVHQRPQEIWQTTQQRIQLLLDSVLANYLDRWMQQPEHTARIRSQTHNLVSSWDQRNIWYALEQCCGCIQIWDRQLASRKVAPQLSFVGTWKISSALSGGLYNFISTCCCNWCWSSFCERQQKIEPEL